MQMEFFPKIGDILELENEQFVVTKINIFQDNFSIRDNNNIDKNVSSDEFSNYKVVGKVKNEEIADDQFGEDLDDV